MRGVKGTRDRAPRKPLTEEQKAKQKVWSKANDEKRKKEGKELPRGVWFRKDILAAIEIYQDEYKAKFGKRIYLKQIVNEAIFDLLIRKKQELLHGEPVRFTETDFDPNKQETIRKHE